MKSQRLLKSLHIGVGNRGLWPVRLATSERGFEAIAYCDPDAGAIAAARGIRPVPESACFNNVDIAIAETEADCAIICAPTHLHLGLVSRCVEAGLAVLVEKGMAPSWSEACQIANVVASAGAKGVVAQNYRYRAAPQAITRLLSPVADGVSIGEAHLMVYQENRVRPQPNNLTYPFASVWDMSCHHFDTMLYWFGPLETMTAQAWRAPWSAYPHPNNTSAHMVFRNGTHVHYLHTHDAARISLHVEVHGEKGAAIWTDAGLTVNERPSVNFGKSPDIAVPITNQEGEIGVLRDFHDYVCLGREPGISVKNNLEVMAMCQMMVLSIEENRTVTRGELD